MINYHPSSPWKNPNWRWERARLIREGALRGLSRKNEDQYTLEVLRFQTALAKCRDEVDRHMLVDRNPGLFHAWTAHRPDGDERGNPLRYAIEARVLAGETYQQTATKLGCSEDTVAWYERAFFNVSDRLQHPDYIMTVVISPTVHTGLAPTEYDVLWKVFAYLYGPIVLDAFVHGAAARSRAESPDEVDIRLSEDIQQSIRRKASIAARTYTLNNFTQEGLMNIYARFLELEKATDAGAAKDTFLNTINLVMNALPFADGTGVVRPDKMGRGQEASFLKVDQPALEHYDSTHAELRTDELLAVTAGRELPNRADIEGMTFPETPDGSPEKNN